MADALPVSPLAPKTEPKLPPLAGVRLGAVEAGIKYAGRKDLLLIDFDEPASVAGVFTTSRCASAPVDWCREKLAAGGTARAVVVNAGNANAFTGKRGADAAALTAKAAAAAVGCAEGEVYLASTGVIGEPLDASGFAQHLDDLAKSASGDGWADAARAIMTTDTYPKLATWSGMLGGKPATINGIAKGSGMIAPDMATMLAFVVTDATVPAALLQDALRETTDTTFNAITVDSDTSTSDTLMAFATGAGEAMVDEASAADFRTALHAVVHDLAMQTVRDGEGATKQVEITVTGARDDRAAKCIALTIANSPLVKTAIAGEDANWGRVVMAVGKAGEEADRDRLSISFGDVRVASRGERDPDYSEEAASAVMREDEISLSVDVGIADGTARVWTCDLTKQYVAINGDYRS